MSLPFFTEVTVPTCRLPGELVVLAGPRPDDVSSSRDSQRASCYTAASTHALARARQASGPITEVLSTQHAALARSEAEAEAEAQYERQLGDHFDEQTRV